MKLNVKILFVTGVVLAVVGTAIGARQPAVLQSKAEPVVRQAPTPGIVKFASGAPELSSLRVLTIGETAMPAERVNGRVVYDENVTARVTSPVGGRVLSSRAEVGDRVVRNAVLVYIDSPDLATAEAEWRKSQAEKLRKLLAFKRARELYLHEVIARKDYESADADYLQTAAEFRRAALRMRNLNASGRENGQFSLKSPVTGVIADKQVNPGLEVRPDRTAPLFVVTDIERLWVIADVPERSIGAITPGQAVQVETDAYPKEYFQAKVDRVGLALDPTTRRVQVRCSLRNPDRKLKPEMFARLSFLADGRKQAVRVPNTSLLVDGLYNYLFVEQQPGVFAKRRVSVVLRDSDSSYIDQGLARGERIVTEGALLLSSATSNVE